MGLLDGPRLPGLFGDPRWEAMVRPNANLNLKPMHQPPPPPPSRLQRLGGGLMQAFGGQNDPRLSEEQNRAAQRAAMMQAGLATIMASQESGASALGSIAQGAMYGQQAGGQAREQAYARTAEERLSQALQDPTVTGKLTAEQRAMIRLLPPREAVEMLTKIAFAPAAAPQVVADGGALVGPDGRVIFENGKAPNANLPADFDVALRSMGIDPALATADQIKAAMPVYQELKRSGAMNVNLNPAGQQEFGNLNTLSASFQRDIAEHAGVANSYGTVLAAASDPSAAGDLALLTSYMKMIDPGARVTDADFANAQNAAGVPEAIRAIYNRAKSGERLTPATRSDFVDRARRLADQKRGQLKPILSRYERRAKAVGLDPSLVIFNPFEEIGVSADAPAPTLGGYDDLPEVR